MTKSLVRFPSNMTRASQTRVSPPFPRQPHQVNVICPERDETLAKYSPTATHDDEVPAMVPIADDLYVPIADRAITAATQTSVGRLVMQRVLDVAHGPYGKCVGQSEITQRRRPIDGDRPDRRSLDRQGSPAATRTGGRAHVSLSVRAATP